MPDEPQDSPVASALGVICTELAEGNGGMSITNCAEVLAAKVMEANCLEKSPIWLEHYEDGARGTVEDPETFDLVTFFFRQSPGTRQAHRQAELEGSRPGDRRGVDRLAAMSRLQEAPVLASQRMAWQAWMGMSTGAPLSIL